MTHAKVQKLIQDNLPSANFRTSIITPEQLRAARGYMDWTRSELAEAAKISPETVKNIEFGTFQPQSATLECLLRTFSQNGIQFLNLGIFAPYTITGVFRVTTNIGEQQ